MTKRKVEERQSQMVRAGKHILKGIGSVISAGIGMIVMSITAMYTFAFVSWFLSLLIYLILSTLLDEAITINYANFISLILTSVLALYLLIRRFRGRTSLIDWLYSRHSYRQQVAYHQHRKEASNQNQDDFQVTRITNLPTSESIHDLIMQDGEIPDDAFKQQF